MGRTDFELQKFLQTGSFRMHMTNKPAKYGIKIVMICNAKTKSTVDAYVGTKTKTSNDILAEYYVKTVTSSLFGANITMDNCFFFG